MRAVPYAYIFFFRGTPLLLQLFIVYYGLAQFEEVRKSAFWPYLRDPYWRALLTMTLHTAAYIAEILRGAIHSVPVGEVEAARALGMSRRQALWHIILPRAVRIGLPAYSNEVILMLKASAVVYTVTLFDIMGMARTIIARTYESMLFFCLAGALYLVITIVLTRIFRLIERWLRVDATQAAERALSDACGAAIIAAPFSRCRSHRVRNLPVPHWRRPVAALPRAGRVPPRTPAALATPPVQRTDPGVGSRTRRAGVLAARAQPRTGRRGAQPAHPPGRARALSAARRPPRRWARSANCHWRNARRHRTASTSTYRDASGSRSACSPGACSSPGRSSTGSTGAPARAIWAACWPMRGNR